MLGYDMFVFDGIPEKRQNFMETWSSDYNARALDRLLQHKLQKLCPGVHYCFAGLDEIGHSLRSSISKFAVPKADQLKNTPW